MVDNTNQFTRAGLLERLRQGYNPPPLWLEAAAEIERLRAALREIADALISARGDSGREEAITEAADIARAALEGRDDA